MKTDINEKTNFKKIYQLAFNKKIVEAKKLMGDMIEDNFINNLRGHPLNDNIFKFVSSFKLPNWHLYFDVSGYQGIDTLSNFKDSSIDLFSKFSGIISEGSAFFPT